MNEADLYNLHNKRDWVTEKKVDDLETRLAKVESRLAAQSIHLSRLLKWKDDMEQGDD